MVNIMPALDEEVVYNSENYGRVPREFIVAKWLTLRGIYDKHARIHMSTHVKHATTRMKQKEKEI